MIYFYTWARNRIIAAKNQIQSHFLSRQSEQGLFVFRDMENDTLEDIRQAALWLSFFSPKKLIILDGFPLNIGEKFSQSLEKEQQIIHILETTRSDTDTLILCLSEKPDKRSKIYKDLLKISTKHEDLTLEKTEDIFSYFSQKFSENIDSWAIQKLILYKSNDPGKIEQEIKKFLITQEHIDSQMVWEHIMPEYEQSIFLFIDSILLKNSKEVFHIFKNLQNHSSFYPLYQSILANLRIFVYIFLLKNQKKNKNEITDILWLWKRSFLVDKNHRTNSRELTQLYEDLISIDKNMKTGQYPSSEESFLFTEIENALIQFLK